MERGSPQQPRPTARAGDTAHGDGLHGSGDRVLCQLPSRSATLAAVTTSPFAAAVSSAAAAVPVSSSPSSSLAFPSAAHVAARPARAPDLAHSLPHPPLCAARLRLHRLQEGQPCCRLWSAGQQAGRCGHRHVLDGAGGQAQRHRAGDRHVRHGRSDRRYLRGQFRHGGCE
eukprot:scaffold8881_cov95-Isochrysis_galbana.AAC.6